MISARDQCAHKKPVFYKKKYFESGFIYTHDLLFELNNNDSFGFASKQMNKIIFYNGQASDTQYPTF